MLYFMLGKYYEDKNINQAWLCYENAEYYCDSESELTGIKRRKEYIEQLEGWSVHKVSIVVLTHNTKDLNIQCIESIRDTNYSSSYELIVVDNASTDGTVEWLKEQKDIKLICNQENKGFPEGCNQGIRASEDGNDILLLNSDTIGLPNAIFWLRMGLYEDEQTGITGATSNSVINHQRIEEKFNSIDEYVVYGNRLNVPMRRPYEKKTWLVGFAMLIKRKALDEVGGVDIRFSPGQYEDMDLCVRMNYAGWKVVLCWNSFIVHYGHGNGANREIWAETLDLTAEKFKRKWNFQLEYYTFLRKEICDLIDHPKEAQISVLDVGCGCGTTLARIEWLWEHASVSGIENDERIAKIAAGNFDVVQGDVETMDFPYEEKAFDYIIFADILEHLRDPERTIKRLKPYLKEDGKLLCSVPNIMNHSVVTRLLQGKFDYADAGILDRTHIHFFTLDSIGKMLDSCGMEMVCLEATYNQEPDEQKDRELFESLRQLPHLAQYELFQVYQFVFACRKKAE